MIYILLNSPELSIERVRLRSLQQPPWFLKNCDAAWIFDKSARPAQIARKTGNTIIVDPAALPEIKEAVRLVKIAK